MPCFLLPAEIKDPLPESLRAQYDLCSLRTALEEIHLPPAQDAFLRARKGWFLRSFFVLQLGLLNMKGRARCESSLRFTGFHPIFFTGCCLFSQRVRSGGPLTRQWRIYRVAGR